MPVTIVESGMTFGPFLNEHFFHIEKSKIYNKLQNGLQIAEFLLIQPEKNRLLVVEAKSSSPNPENKESQITFDDFIAEITEKLSNSFTLGLALCLERHVDHKDEISKCFKDIALDSVKIVLLLVINGHKEEWLAPLSEALQEKLKRTSRIWPLEVLVLNEKMAQSYNLIEETMV